MKIAVPYESGKIFQHFGHTEKFKIYDTEKNLSSGQVIDTEGSGHGALAGFLRERGVEVLICGGIGGGAIAVLGEAGIRVFGGVEGNADDAVRAFCDGKLVYDPDVKCSHHSHPHGDGQDCGSHACGGGGCGKHTD